MELSSWPEVYNVFYHLQIISDVGILSRYIYEHSGQFPRISLCSGMNGIERGSEPWTMLSIENSLTLRLWTDNDDSIGRFSFSYRFVPRE